MNVRKFLFELPEDAHEFLIAELLDLDFYGFEQEGDRLTAYVLSSQWNDTHREQLEGMMVQFPGSTLIETEEIEPRNWNEEWEQSIQPIRVGCFFITPSWIPVDLEAAKNYAETGLSRNQGNGSASRNSQRIIPLMIDPKMSFGTGYHPTTRLMLRALEELDVHYDAVRNATVIDAGSGSGILGIAAAKLGASMVYGFDMDPVCLENAIENTDRNGVSNMTTQTGGFGEVVLPETADVTLANIHLAVLLHYMEDLKAMTRPGGLILLSGLLDKDENEIRLAAERAGLEFLSSDQEEEWICCRFRSVI